MTSAEESVQQWEKELRRMQAQKEGVERKIANLKAKLEAGREIIARTKDENGKPGDRL